MYFRKSFKAQRQTHAYKLTELSVRGRSEKLVKSAFEYGKKMKNVHTRINS